MQVRLGELGEPGELPWGRGKQSAGAEEVRRPVMHCGSACLVTAVSRSETDVMPRLLGEQQLSILDARNFTGPLLLIFCDWLKFTVNNIHMRLQIVGRIFLAFLNLNILQDKCQPLSDSFQSHLYWKILLTQHGIFEIAVLYNWMLSEFWTESSLPSWQPEPPAYYQIVGTKLS
jgi:hypothetical protein